MSHQRRHGFNLLKPSEREDYGVIVTVDMDGDTLVFQETGGARAALTRLLERLDAMDRPYRVVTISTPQTIYSDLHGRPETTVPGAKGEPRVGAGWAEQPERNMLSAIGRLDVAPPAQSGAAEKGEQRMRGLRNVCAEPRCLSLTPAGWVRCREHTRERQRRAMKRAS